MKNIVLVLPGFNKEIGRDRTGPNKSYLCVMPCQNICYTVELSHDFYFWNLLSTSCLQQLDFTLGVLSFCGLLHNFRAEIAKFQARILTKNIRYVQSTKS